jgi:hypothetical protein
MNGLADFGVGFGLNLLVALLAVRCIYYPATRDRNYVFTFLAFNSIIFCVVRFMGAIQLSVGVGFGLFAIFSVLRYRTDPIPIREMTYLFVIAALAVMNSLGLDAGVSSQLLAANGGVLVVMFALERAWGFRFQSSKRVTYERIELIKPQNRARLLADLRERTGLPVERCVVGRIDFLRDTAEVTIYYPELPAGGSSPAAVMGEPAVRSDEALPTY